MELRVTLGDGKALEGSTDYQRGDSFLWRIYEYLLRVTKVSPLYFDLEVLFSSIKAEGLVGSSGSSARG